MTTSPTLGSQRLLLIDDADAFREVLSIKLRRAGYVVIEASTGRQGLDEIASGNTDLVLLDLRLPDIPGRDILSEIRRSRSLLDLPVIVISGLGDPDEVVEALRAGANDYLTKPFDLTVALQRIRTQITVRELKQAHDRFLQVASHDLKKPLLLMREVARDLEARRSVQGVISDPDHTLAFLIDSADHMQAIVEELLGIERLREGRQSLLRISHDLGALVRQAITRNAVYAQRKQVALSLRVNPALPPVDLDQFRILQVLDNLIGNALKFSPPATQTCLSVRCDDRWVICEVTDQGPGIPEEARSRLFTAFATTDNQPTGNEHSTGLGLSICREIIALHGGDIGVHNEQGGGATFWFALPRDPGSPILIR